MYKVEVIEEGTIRRLDMDFCSEEEALLYASSVGHASFQAINVEMESAINLFIQALKIGIVCGVDGLFFFYIGKTEGNHSYSIEDPALGSDDEVYSEGEIRRRLEVYYTSHPEELEGDLQWVRETLVGN